MGLKQKLAAGQVVRFFGLGTFLQPEWITLVGNLGGYDAVWLDDEHIGLNRRQVADAALAARAAGLDSFVRLHASDYAKVMQPLEAGCTGIMAAQIHSAAEAEQVVRWAKFHPRGERGANGLNADNDFDARPLRPYFAHANATTFIAIQIENRAAVEDIAAIAAVPDVDVLFIGPADLSQSLGIPGDYGHPKLREAISRVADVARQQRRPWSILPMDDPMAKWCLSLGCQGFLAGFDTPFICHGVRAFQANLPSVFTQAAR